MKPLAGIRILEFDGLGPVTFAGMVLADLGADVLRLTRSATAGAAVFEEVGGEVLHRGRPAVAVDLKSESDRAAVLDLVTSAHGIIEGFRPRVMERLGLGPADLHAVNPSLVFARITGWGQTGPLADQVGHDINYIGLTGALNAIGPADRPPPPPLNLIGDYGGGAMLGLVGLLAALLEARNTGRGRVVDAAMTDGSAMLSALFHALRVRGLWTDQRGSNLLDGGTPFYRCFTCADGKFVAVGALEPRFYAALLAGLEIAPDEAPQYDMRGWPALHARFEAAFAARPRDDWAAHFAGTEACVTPVLSFGEAAAHPHNAARGTLVDGAPAPAPRFDGQASAITPQPAPMSLDQAKAAWAWA